MGHAHMTVASFARARRGNRYLRFYLTRSHRRRATCRLSRDQKREAKPQRSVLFSPTINILPQSPPTHRLCPSPAAGAYLLYLLRGGKRHLLFLGLRLVFRRLHRLGIVSRGATLKSLLPGCFCSSHLHVEPSYFCSAGTDFV